MIHRPTFSYYLEIAMANITDKTKRQIRLFSDEALAMILRSTPALRENRDLFSDDWDHCMDQCGDDDSLYESECDATESDIY